MNDAKPICIDLFCGLGGWSEAFLAEGYECIGYDVEAHEYGEHRYPGRLVLRDVRSIHGSEFRDAAIIVASPPCQEFSYMAMPWSRAKKKLAQIEADTSGTMRMHLTELFNACFRIVREASEAARRPIPMLVENVRGAQRWVGPARWHYGSFYLWGDVPALMPMTIRSEVPKCPGESWQPTRPSYTKDHSWKPDALKTTGHANIRDGHTHPRLSIAAPSLPSGPQPSTHTSFACGPFGPWATVNDTRAPSSRLL